MRSLLVVAVLCASVFGMGAGLLTFVSSRDQVITMAVVDAYAEYLEAAERQLTILNQPAQGSNTDRQELFRALTRILTESLDDAERLMLAKDALDHNALLRARIDEASVSREQVEEAVNILARSAMHSRRAEATELVRVARERQAAVSDILATLYAINSHTDMLLSTIIENHGTLSDEMIRELNVETSMAEARFDRLRTRYHEVHAYDNTLNELSSRLVAFVL